MKRLVLVAGIGVVVVAAIALLPGGIPLIITVHGSQATAHMGFLGEYQNDVELIELKRADTSQVIWRAVGGEGMMQLHEVRFVAGDNSAKLSPAWGEARTEIPNASASFILSSDADYVLRVCPPSWWRRCVSKSFRLGQA